MEGSYAARKIINVKEEFEEENFLELVTKRDRFYDYVSESTLDEYFQLI